ncbi:hypothetical protein ISN44_As08g037590 [Arabidopsis suecica]|uniref:WAT1-related protein n=1 Tax=Arabidopsis suecica TaxID=45249 RepID=A0A8T2BGL0_ARASU|nr:hypothetical protein ISN44_As08g037590 [Arabidopsis suecica]
MMALMSVLGTFESAIAALIWEGERMSVWKPNPNVTLLASLYGIKSPVYLSMFSPLKLVITAIISSVAMSEELYVGRVVGAATIIIGISIVLWGKMRDGEQMSPVDAMADDVSIYVSAT